jgi:hypothetical protein
MRLQPHVHFFLVALVSSIGLAGCSAANTPTIETAPRNIARVVPDVIQNGDGSPFFEFPLPNGRLGRTPCPTDIVRAPDGNYWMPDSCNHQFIYVSNSGAIGTVAVSGDVWSVADGADGNSVWGGSYSTPRIFRVDLQTRTVEDISIACTAPTMTAGADGNMWFGIGPGCGTASLGRIDSSNHVTTFPLLQSGVSALVLGPDKDLWFASVSVYGRFNTTNESSVVWKVPPGANFIDVCPYREGVFAVGDQNGTPALFQLSENGGVSTFLDKEVLNDFVACSAGPSGLLWMVSEQLPAPMLVSFEASTGTFNAPISIPAAAGGGFLQ